jgi:hypothetical protein
MKFITKIYSLVIFSFLIFSFISLPTAFATIQIGCSSSPAGTGSTTSGCITTKIENPLSSDIDSIPKLIQAILDIVLTIGVPIVALAIVYSGFLFVKAQGNTEAISKAKKTLMYTLIGAALLLGSWVLANAIQGTVNELKKSAMLYPVSRLYS